MYHLTSIWLWWNNAGDGGGGGGANNLTGFGITGSNSGAASWVKAIPSDCDHATSKATCVRSKQFKTTYTQEHIIERLTGTRKQ